MDENIVQVYDLLDLFCEFILSSLPYICKQRECPNDNDMNEAISTLIFSSAIFGELPELLPIRKLFSKLYGQRFVTVALQLLPGNFVNNQIKENVHMKKVSDDVKYQLLNEISRSSDQIMWNGEKDTIQEDEYSSSQNSSKFPEEVTYLDDIEEFVPPLVKDGKNLQDQRLFVFRTFGQGKELSIKTAGILGQDQKNYTRCLNDDEESDKAVVIRRAMSLPCEREKDCSDLVDKIERSFSLPCPHVHPNLPDYDELAAKFTELKRANILKQNY